MNSTESYMSFEQTPGIVLPGVKCKDIDKIVNVVGIDWFRCSIPSIYQQKTIDKISEYYGEYNSREPGRFGYTDLYFWESGASLSFDSDPQRLERVHQNQISLDLPGRCLAQLDFIDLFLLLSSVYHDLCPQAITRLDVFWDDFQRQITPHEIADIAKRGDFTGFRKFQPEIEFKRDEGEIVYIRDCVRFGSRGSNGGGKYLRIYDKNLESGGNHNSIRWEVELKGPRAFKTLEVFVLSKTLESCCEFLAGVVGGSISFVKRLDSNDRHIQKLEPYYWWNTIKNRLGTVRFRNPEVLSRDLVDSCRHVYKQYRNLFATIREWFRRYGDSKGFVQFIQKMADDGIVNDRYQKMLEQAGSPYSEIFVQNHLPFDWK